MLKSRQSLRRTLALIVAAIAAGSAFADDSVSRALLQRQQQSDAFALQLRQSNESFRAQSLPPAQRRELESLHFQQRQQQDVLNARELRDLQSTPAPQLEVNGGSARHQFDLINFEREREMQQQRFAREAAQAVARPQPAVPNPQPAPSGFSLP